jgi:hypothetical protein
VVYNINSQDVTFPSEKTLRRMESPRLSLGSPGRLNPEDEKLLQDMRNKINELTAENAYWASENKKAHEKELKLERQLESISKAIDSNVDVMTSSIEILMAENEELRPEIEEREALANEICQICQTLVDAGTDLSTILGLDLDFLSEWFPDIQQKPVERPPIILDPHVYKVIIKYPEFGYCRSNEEVVDDCRKIQEELRQMMEERKSRAGPVERLAQEMVRYQKTSAKVAYEFKDLLTQRDARSSACSTLIRGESSQTGSLFGPSYGSPVRGVRRSAASFRRISPGGTHEAV